jgi:hypothetical protein
MKYKEIEIDYIVTFNPKDIDKIFLVNKNTDPITAFYEMLIVQIGLEQEILNGARPETSFVIINRDLYNREVYGRILHKYARKKKGDFYTKKYLDLSVSMLDLDIGPNTDNQVPENEIWILKGFLTNDI